MTAVIAKCILLLINTFFLVIGIAFTTIGVILTFVPGKVLEDVFDSVKKTANTGAYSIPDSADDIANVPFLRTLGVALLVFGVVLFAICLLAYVGACCPTCCRCLLILYAIVVVILILVEIVLGTMFFVSSSPLHTEAKNGLIDKIESDYDERGTDAFSTSLNLIQHYFDCCGIESEKDFGVKPHSSCDAAYLNVGCYTKLQDKVEDNIIWCGLGLAFICLLQLVQVICAIAIYKDNKIGPI